MSDVILLGTEEQVRLASRAVTELVAGGPIHTGELVISLRNFIRQALDLAPYRAISQSPCRGRRGRPAPAGAKAQTRRLVAVEVVVGVEGGLASASLAPPMTSRRAP